MWCFRFGKVFLVTHAKSFFLAASPLVTSTSGQRSVSRHRRRRIPLHAGKILWWPGCGSIQLCLNVCFSIPAMKMLAKATATFVPMAIPWVCRLLLPKNWNYFSFNISKSTSLRYLVGTLRGGGSRGYSRECLVGVSRPLHKMLTLFHIKKMLFPTPVFRLVS